MKDLISRKALLAAARKVSEYDEAGFHVSYKAVPVEEIEKASAVEAEPARHGRWVRNDLGETYCSDCSNRIPFVECFDSYPDCCMDDEDMRWNEEIERTNYCPNCGARMDAKEDD